jgi:outer membrane protein assembly factor BamB
MFTSMKAHVRTLWLVALFLPAVLQAGDNWPQFRGPTGDGHSDAKGLPVAWSETEHIKWKVPIHDKGWSSPVIWGDQIWLTTAKEDGSQLFVLALNKHTGKVLHDVKLFDAEQPILWKGYNSYASPTPVIEENRVYVTFGRAGTACLDTKTAKVLWQRRDLLCDHFRGAGSSPVLFGNLLIMNFDGVDQQFVVALDKATGKTVWQTKRSVDFKDIEANGKPKADGDLRKAYATPMITIMEGKPVLLSSGAKAHYAYDPLTGKEYWRVEAQPFHSTGSRPLFGHGMMFIQGGFSKGHLFAVKPPPASAWNGGVLDAAKDDDPQPGKPQLVWRVKKGVPEAPSALLVGDLIFMVDNGGFASCLEAMTGKEVWSQRVTGSVYASPITADARVYTADKKGKVAVFAAAREFKLLAENQLDGEINASPAVSGKALFYRTAQSLYRIEQ